MTKQDYTILAVATVVTVIGALNIDLMITGAW